MRLVIVSDTHGLHGTVQVPDGDVLIHAGDMARVGTLDEIKATGDWLATLPHPHKIVVAGNHDWPFEVVPFTAERILGPGVTYLEDSGVVIDGVRFWGSPWQPAFNNWAFNLRRDGPELAAKWALVPTDTDVLITHGPPKGVLDKNLQGEALGCAALRDRLRELHVKVHAFGHIHEGSGMIERAGTLYVNACICDAAYAAVNPPRVVEM